MVSACSPASLVNALTSGAGSRVTADLAYAPGPRHGLDVYVPVKSYGPVTVVVFFYGGGWTSGDKATYRFLGRTLAADGVLVVIPDYRVYPAVGFPAFLQDAALAVSWAERNAARFGGDPRRLFLMGHSAGAYIAAMLALDPIWLRGVGIDQRRDLAGVIGIAGPYDFLPLDSDTLKAIFEREPWNSRSRSISWTAPRRRCCCWPDPPIPRWIRRTPPGWQRASVRQAELERVLYPGVGHVGVIGALRHCCGSSRRCCAKRCGSSGHSDDAQLATMPYAVPAALFPTPWTS